MECLKHEVILLCLLYNVFGSYARLDVLFCTISTKNTTELTPAVLQTIGSKCSDVVYSFLPIDTKTKRLKIMESTEKEIFDNFKALRNTSRLHVAIGGVDEKGEDVLNNVFPDGFMYPESIRLVEQVIKFVIDNCLDGMQVVWWRPTLGNMIYEINGNLKKHTVLLKDFDFARKELKQKQAIDLMLTAVATPDLNIAELIYMESLEYYVDYLFLPTYGVTSKEHPVIHSQVSSSPNSKSQSWVKMLKVYEKYVQKQKLGLGYLMGGMYYKIPANVSFISQNYTLTDSSKADVGFLSYMNICKIIKERNLTKNYDQNALGAYTYLNDGNTTTWIGFDDDHTVSKKLEWTNKHQFTAIWVLGTDLDDPHGEYCGYGPFPLLSRISLRDFYIIKSSLHDRRKQCTDTDGRTHPGFVIHEGYSYIYTSLGIVTAYLTTVVLILALSSQGDRCSDEQEQEEDFKIRDYPDRHQDFEVEDDNEMDKAPSTFTLRNNPFNSISAIPLKY